MAPSGDFYTLLKVSQSASPEEIADALRRELMMWSRRAANAPKAADRSEAEQRVEELGQAKATLTDPARRAAYDQTLGIKPRMPIIESIIPETWRDQQPPSDPTQRYRPPRGAGWQAWIGVMFRWARAHKRISALIVIVLIAVIASAGHGGSGGGSSKVSPQTRAAIQAAIVPAIESCAQSAETDPANCPQDVGVEGVTGVVWHLYGDPATGVEITPSGSGYTVVGATVMTLHYDEDGDTTFEVEDIDYQATATVNNGHARLHELQASDEQSTETKPRPNLSDRAVDAAVQAAFARCVASTSVVPPEYCPANDPDADPDSGTQVTWSMASRANPLLNSTISYDSTYGVLHVVGSYNLSIHFVEDGDAESQNFTGDYDAVVADERGSATVLDIQSS
jgi:hypothetical protein